MRKLEIKSYGIYLPENTITFGESTRYRIKNETQIDMAAKAIQVALTNANMKINDIDCIVSACAVGSQPIPCTAALIHERVAKGTSIPAMDINTTCTSFITALDVMSYMLEANRYKNIIIVSSEVGSLGLNPKQTESFELFSDAAVAVIVSATNEDLGILYSLQATYSEGAHSTEIRGGLSNFLPKYYNEETKEEYMFDMKGKAILHLSIKNLPPIFEKALKESNLKLSDIDMVVPHQASKALRLAMQKLGVPNAKFIDLVNDYGNMVSASVPFALCTGLEKGLIKKGDIILLLGTAAGLTINVMILRV